MKNFVLTKSFCDQFWKSIFHMVWRTKVSVICTQSNAYFLSLFLKKFTTKFSPFCVYSPDWRSPLKILHFVYSYSDISYWIPRLSFWWTFLLTFQDMTQMYLLCEAFQIVCCSSLCFHIVRFTPPLSSENRLFILIF